MKKITKFLSFMFISFMISCEQPANETSLTFTDIKQFPQEIMIHHRTENFVVQTDTFLLENEKNAHITLKINRPQYVSVQKEGKFLHLFLEPGSALKISKENGRYVINGDLKGENTYLQDIRNDKELLEKAWDYSVPFDQFKQQVDNYFDFKGKLLDKNVTPHNASYFYRLSTLEDRVFHNSILLDYIRTQSPAAEKDSLFFEYFDTDLLGAKYTKDYLESGYLRSFYSKKGVAYFARKKYGEKLDSIRKHKEHFAFRDDIISEYFDQPLKSILIYEDLRYYPEEYDYLSDSLRSHFTNPRELISRYKEELHEEAYTDLQRILDDYEFAKSKYAKGKSIPDFLLKDESNQAYELKSAEFDKLTLVDIWASWCGPCIQSFPRVRGLEKQYADQLKVVSVSIDNKFDQYKKGLKKYELPGQLRLYAENGFTSDFAKHFQITAIPRYMLISSNGKIVNANMNLSDIENILK